MRLPPVLSIMLLIVFAAPATAQVAPVAPGGRGQPVSTIVAEPAAMLIATCDSDGDGRTTRAELDACLARSFAAADIDSAGAHAGSIGYIGYADWSLKWLGDRNVLPSPFTVDADNDNRITLAELQARFAAILSRFDADKDGAATRAELLTIKSGAGAEPRGGKRGRGRRAPPEPR